MTDRSKTPAAIAVEDRPRSPFFTTATLAAYLAVSERTIRDMLKRGEFPSYKIAGARRIDPADVDSYLAERRHGKAAALRSWIEQISLRFPVSALRSRSRSFSLATSITVNRL